LPPSVSMLNDSKQSIIYGAGMSFCFSIKDRGRYINVHNRSSPFNRS
jgi:hypothetical protein